jgi:ABC-2 type transport system ATP-binding protein
MPTDPILETSELHKQFGTLHAVDGLSFSVQRGEIYGLLGPNGSGKTTLIRLLMGLLKPTSGRIRLLGEAVPNKTVMTQVGYMTQASALYEDLTVRENIAFFAEMCGRRDPAWTQEVLDLVHLQDRARSLVRTLSGGLKQRTSLACSLAHKPRLLFLDEPTVGVDPRLRATFWSHFRRLAETGVTIIVSSHVMDEAERCDRLGFIRKGRLLAEGSAESLRRQARVRTLEEAFLQFAGDGEGEAPA